MSAEPHPVPPVPVWALVANVVGSCRYGPGGAQVRRGVRTFSGVGLDLPHRYRQARGLDRLADGAPPTGRPQ